MAIMYFIRHIAWAVFVFKLVFLEASPAIDNVGDSPFHCSLDVRFTCFILHAGSQC